MGTVLTINLKHQSTRVLPEFLMLLGSVKHASANTEDNSSLPTDTIVLIIVLVVFAVVGCVCGYIKVKAKLMELELADRRAYEQYRSAVNASFTRDNNPSTFTIPTTAVQTVSRSKREVRALRDDTPPPSYEQCVAPPPSYDVLYKQDM